MGANVYLESVASYGYETEAAATVIYQGIQPVAGKRIGIRAFSMTPGTGATDAYFMQVLGTSVTAAAIASGATTGFGLSAQPYASVTLGSSDYVAIELDNGAAHFSKVATGSYSDFSISTALTDSVAVGNTVWFFGAYGDAAYGHLLVKLAASTTKAINVDGGVFYGKAKGYPMLAFHRNSVAGSAGSIDYIT